MHLNIYWSIAALLFTAVRLEMKTYGQKNKSLNQADTYTPFNLPVHHIPVFDGKSIPGYNLKVMF